LRGFTHGHEIINRYRAYRERALKVSGERTTKAVVTKALEEFIARRLQKPLLELMGKLEWDPSYDYQAGRSRD